MTPKIAFVGAGSVEFTGMLVADILAYPELRDTVISLHDIDPERLETARGVVQATHLEQLFHLTKFKPPALEHGNHGQASCRMVKKGNCSGWLGLSPRSPSFRVRVAGVKIREAPVFARGVA